MMQPAALSERDDATGRTVALSGNLSLSCLGDLPRRLDAIDGDVAQVDLGAIEHIDTIGAWVVHRFASAPRRASSAPTTAPHACSTW